MKKTTKTDTIKYGDYRLPVLYMNDPLVPQEAQEVTMPKADKNAIAQAVLQNKPCLLIGETGTGKTSAVRELAYLTASPYIRVNMTGYTTPDDLIGSKSVKDGQTYYEHGIITNAMQRGAILVLDEINATTPDCMFILHGLLDQDKRITLPNGDVITPDDNFRVFATCNPDYEGTKSMNKALLDRFPIIVAVDVLPPKQEQSFLVKHTGIADTIAQQLVHTAVLLRQSYTEQKLSIFTSTRTLRSIAELIQAGMPMKQAATIALVHKSNNKQEQRAIMDVFNSVLKLYDAPDTDQTPVITTQGVIKQYEARLDEWEKRVQKLQSELAIAQQEKQPHHS